MSAVITPEQRQRDNKILHRIRGQLEAIHPGQWTLTDGGEGMVVDVRGPQGELWTMAHFHAGASQDEMEMVAFAPANLRFLLGLLKQAFAEIRRLQAAGDGARSQQDAANARPAKDHTTEVVMICERGDFRRFLADCHGLEEPLTYDRATQRLRSVLRIKSRKELNKSAEAVARWIALRSDFDAWKRGLK